MFVFVKIIILMSKCIAKSEVIAWQSRGHGFEPRYLHQEKTDSPKGLSVFSFGKPKEDSERADERKPPVIDVADEAVFSFA